MAKKRCKFSWCGIDGRYCVDCTERGLDKPQDQPAAPVPEPLVLMPGGVSRMPGQEGPAPAPSDSTPLTAFEALEAGFLTLCSQYQQMGQQLKFMAGVIAELKNPAGGPREG